VRNRTLGNPGVVQATMVSPQTLYVLGRAVGTTNMIVQGRSGSCSIINVVVNADAGGLQTSLGQLLPGEPGIRVMTAADNLVLTGSVTNAQAALQAMEIAQAYANAAQGGDAGKKGNVLNMMSVDTPQQVMLEVKVAEISKSLLDQFGIDFSRAYTTGSMLRFLSGVFGGSMGVVGQIGGGGPNGVPYSSVDQVVGGTVPIPNMAGGNVTVTYDANGRPTYTTSYGMVPGRGATNVGINMQKNDGLVKVLAEPTVMAISGQTGSFLAGGKIFIPVTQDNGAGGRTVTLEEKEFGVSLKFTPTVLGSGLINLRVRPEVSELNAAGVQVSAGGVSAVLPSFTSRKAETTVQLMDGQSFAIGGLIKNNTTTNVTAFPLLGELPVIGALFRSTSFQTDKSELVFVITPRLVKPLPPGYRLPTDDYVPPTRSELIWDGRIEGSRPDPSSHAAAAPAEGGFEQEKH
jgi:pilus assembly protein CpaC